VEIKCDEEDEEAEGGGGGGGQTFDLFGIALKLP